MTDLLTGIVRDDAPGVLLTALGPWIGPLRGGSRKPSIFRVRYQNNVFLVENKHGTGKFGRWKALTQATSLAAAVKSMTHFNDRELAKHGLSQCPPMVDIQAELAKFGLSVL